MNNRYAIVTVIIVLVALGLLWVANNNNASTTNTVTTSNTVDQNPGVATTTGTTNTGTVSTSTTTTTPTGPITVQARIGVSTPVLGFSITPVAILEDSRCPADVQCIQAGTVRANVRIGGVTREFKLDQAMTVAGKTITMTDVLPVKNSGKTIANSDYIFTFEIK